LQFFQIDIWLFAACNLSDDFAILFAASAGSRVSGIRLCRINQVSGIQP